VKLDGALTPGAAGSIELKAKNKFDGSTTSVGRTKLNGSAFATGKKSVPAKKLLPSKASSPHAITAGGGGGGSTALAQPGLGLANRPEMAVELPTWDAGTEDEVWVVPKSSPGEPTSTVRAPIVALSRATEGPALPPSPWMERVKPAESFLAATMAPSWFNHYNSPPRAGPTRLPVEPPQSPQPSGSPGLLAAAVPVDTSGVASPIKPYHSSGAPRKTTAGHHLPPLGMTDQVKDVPPGDGDGLGGDVTAQMMAMRAELQALRREHAQAQAELKRLRAEKREGAHLQGFQDADADGNNSLNFEELKAKFGNFFSDADLKAIMQEFDRNGDGELQVDEWMAAHSKFQPVHGETDLHSGRSSGGKAAMMARASAGLARMAQQAAQKERVLKQSHAVNMDGRTATETDTPAQ